MLEWRGRGVVKIKREGTTQFGRVAGGTSKSIVVNTYNINVVNRQMTIATRHGLYADLTNV